MSGDPLVDAFLDTLWAERGLSANTLDGYRRDLIAFLCRFDLSQHQLVGRSPGTHHVNGRLAVTGIMRATQGLAINSDNLITQHLAQ